MARAQHFVYPIIFRHAGIGHKRVPFPVRNGFSALRNLPWLRSYGAPDPIGHEIYQLPDPSNGHRLFYVLLGRKTPRRLGHLDYDFSALRLL